jgi:hypothetical protein
MDLSDPALARAREILRQEQASHIGDVARALHELNALLPDSATAPTVLERTLDALQWRKRLEPTDEPGVVRRGLWKFECDVEEKRIRMAEELIRRVEPGPYEDANYFALLAYQAASVELCTGSLLASCRTAGVGADQRWPRFLLGTVHAAKVNAFARVLRHLDFIAVLIHSALVDFMYQAAKAVIAACHPVRSHGGKCDVETTPEQNAIEAELDRNPEPVERLYRTLEAYYFRGYPRAFVNEHVGEESHPPLSMLISLSERFVIAHEYGHSFAIKVSQLTDFDNPEWAQELLADQFGMYATVLSARMLDAVDPVVSLSAAAFAMACLSVLARGLSVAREGVVPKDEGSKSHPPSRMRAEWIVADYHELFRTEFRPDGRGCVAVRRSQPLKNALDVDQKVREHVASGVYAHADALFTIWRRVGERLLRDFQSGRPLHSMWAAADSLRPL